jgi:hypothetical protein
MILRYGHGVLMFQVLRFHIFENPGKIQVFLQDLYCNDTPPWHPAPCPAAKGCSSCEHATDVTDVTDVTCMPAQPAQDFVNATGM